MKEQHIRTIIKKPESEWLEFKKDNFKPEKIGENISAISNSLPLLQKSKGYIIWGIDSSSNEITGTKFKPKKRKIGNEELENWILIHLKPQVHFDIHEICIEGKQIVIFEISPSESQPASFKGHKYIRVGSYTKKLNDHPEKERALWKSFDKIPFEQRIAVDNVDAEEVLRLIDYPNYFDKMNEPLPEGSPAILDRLSSEKIILAKNDSNVYSVTNSGAILFCKNMTEFPHLARKAPRVISYDGVSKVKALREKEFVKGYALDFDNIIEYIDIQVPKNEEIGRAFRQEIPMYPHLAIRELVANALIHQDFNSPGNILIEIFSDRIEISNSGKPLIETLRFIDEAPTPRNESLVRFMRKLNIAEDRGTGIDKVITEIELYQLPPPDFRNTDRTTTVTLYGIKKFDDMTSDERIRACYQHACLCWVSRKSMTNETLRNRLKLEKKQYAAVHKILSDTIKNGLIRKEGKVRWTQYKPYWA